MPISEVYNIDCLEYMRTLPDKFFDLAIVDPPYGIGADCKNSKKELKSKKSAAISRDYGNQKWDSKIPEEEYFNELFRISKNQIVWGANYFGLSGGGIFWDKCVTMPTYSDGEYAFYSGSKNIKMVKIAWHGMIQQDMKNKESRIHPTQKPIALYKWLLENYAKLGDKIFDSHMGSQSSRIAAYHMGFDYYGCELDKEYFDAGNKRFYIEKTKVELFAPEQPKVEQSNLF